MRLLVQENRDKLRSEKNLPGHFLGALEVSLGIVHLFYSIAVRDLQEISCLFTLARRVKESLGIGKTNGGCQRGHFNLFVLIYMLRSGVQKKISCPVPRPSAAI